MRNEPNASRERMDRRAFLWAAGAGGAAGLLARPLLARPWGDEPPEARPQPTLLVLGGTNFVGPAIVAAAQEQGFAVTTFTRGRTDGGPMEGVEKLVGDRDPRVGEGLKALEGRRFDAVIDTSGHVPRHVRASAEILCDGDTCYAFVSSGNAYASDAEPGADEDAPRARLEHETEDFRDPAAFGPLKASCEEEVERICGARAVIVRPGLIVGPRDRSGRFTYWVARYARGGDVLAPGDPERRIAFIDSRDLARFLVRLVAAKQGGRFNALGPSGGIAMAKVLAACKSVAAVPSTTTWVPDEFLLEQGVRPWSDLPLWLPPHPDNAGFFTRSLERSLAAGLEFRPLEDTARDTLEWWRALPDEVRARPRTGLSAEREAAVLAAWRARGG